METPYHQPVKLNQSIMFCLIVGLLPPGKVYLHSWDLPFPTRGACVSIKCLQRHLSALFPQLPGPTDFMTPWASLQLQPLFFFFFYLHQLWFQLFLFSFLLSLLLALLSVLFLASFLFPLPSSFSPFPFLITHLSSFVASFPFSASPSCPLLRCSSPLWGDYWFTGASVHLCVTALTPNQFWEAHFNFPYIDYLFSGSSVVVLKFWLTFLLLLEYSHVPPSYWPPGVTSRRTH